MSTLLIVTEKPLKGILLTVQIYSMNSYTMGWLSAQQIPVPSTDFSNSNSAEHVANADMAFDDAEPTVMKCRSSNLCPHRNA
jgi:hypothetical protein